MSERDDLAALGWTLQYSGKVRELYARADLPDAVLIVASDRVSAYDHILEPAIPGKGALLTNLSRWWFAQFPDVPNHLVPDTAPLRGLPEPVVERAMLVHRLAMHPIECVVRGYLTGSGWLEYQANQSVCGVPLPTGLQDGDRLPEPIYTPAWKAPLGQHDENISFERTVELVGPEIASALRDTSLRIFAAASEVAEARGVILADTKFEFGALPGGRSIVLADEVLTSDSSRYWDKAEYDAGNRGVSWDKQGVRDWLRARWDGTGTPPRLDEEIVERTRSRYAELVERLTR